MKFSQKISRRDFFKNATLKTMFAGITLSGLKRDDKIKNFFVNKFPRGEKVSIKSYRGLGNTGFKVSDISLGAGRLSYGPPIRYAIDCGVNYIDTAPFYGPSERLIGEVLKEKRKDVFITTKFSKIAWRTKNPVQLKKNLHESIENSLKDLRTDYLDAIIIHSASLEQMKSDEVHEVFKKVKKEGKVRYLGISTHERIDVIKQFLEDESMMILSPAYNYLSEKNLAYNIKKNAEKGKAIVAMKALLGAYLERLSGWNLQSFGDDFEKLSVDEKRSVMTEYSRSGKIYAGVFARSAFKWVLSNLHMNTVLASIRTFDDVNSYLPASGEKFGLHDKEILDIYVAFIWDKYCRIGCDICYSYCLEGIPINDILRFQMYYENYGDKRMAVFEYSDLPKDKLGDNCYNCNAPCQKSCPYGIAVKERLIKTHETLSKYC